MSGSTIWKPIRPQVTFYEGLSRGMPETELFTKIAVSPSLLILPIETRRGDIWILERPD